MCLHPSDDGTTHNEAKVQDQVLNMLPHGYKFCPNDVELIEYYLKRKIDGDPIIPGRIHDVDVYKQSPDQLDKKYKYKGEQQTYYFTPRSKKYRNGKRPDRAVGDYGFWKATGEGIPISNNTSTVIGSKRSLVFYKGKPTNAVKTNWIMQEFTINNPSSSSATPSNEMHLDDWVLCKIYENKREKKCQNNQEATISTNVVVTPQCQPNQHFHAQHVQTSLSTNEVAISHSQPNQHMQASLSVNMVANPQYLPNQHSEHMQSSLFGDMVGISQYHQPNQHSQAQHVQASLSADMVVMPQDQPNQHSQAHMDVEYSDPYDLISIDFDAIDTYLDYFESS